MKQKQGLNETWIKASIVATVWAASEIVLGSFLHNLRIPFSGNILTGIGLMVLISVSHRWTEKGLIWRAGLLTAMMKTLSPSAVIFGPMLAIMAEAVLLELAVRLLGRSLAGYLVGGMLAMSWNLVQKLANLLLFYGYNIVTLYENLIQMARTQSGIQSDITWLPVLLLLGVNMILGASAAVAGMRTGRSLQQQAKTNPPDISSKARVHVPQKKQADFNYSLIWLSADALLLLTALYLLHRSDGLIWSSFVVLLITVWAVRYRRALRQLTKPKFWISFILITMLTAWVFSSNGNIMTALLIGLQMNCRAAVIILGLAVLGTELYHPKVRALFKKGSFNQLAAALDLSLAGLPSVIAEWPDARTLCKNPVGVLYHLLSSIDHRLAEIVRTEKAKIFIIAGAIDQGKTACVQHLLELARAADMPLAGIYTRKIIERGETVGYDVVDIKRGEGKPFLRSTGDEGADKIGRFTIVPTGWHHGRRALAAACASAHRLIVVDEVGKLELQNTGWWPELEQLAAESEKTLVLTVRDIYTDPVIEKLQVTPLTVYRLSENDGKNIAASIVQKCLAD